MSKLAQQIWDEICTETAKGGDKTSVDIIDAILAQQESVKELLFDEIVNLINQPCDDHRKRVAEIQSLVSTHECPECHAKQFLVFGSHGECQYCGISLIIRAAKIEGVKPQ